MGSPYRWRHFSAAQITLRKHQKWRNSGGNEGTYLILKNNLSHFPQTSGEGGVWCAPQNEQVPVVLQSWNRVFFDWYNGLLYVYSNWNTRQWQYPSFLSSQVLTYSHKLVSQQRWSAHMENYLWLKLFRIDLDNTPDDRRDGSSAYLIHGYNADGTTQKRFS